MRTIEIPNSKAIPLLGLGTWKLSGNTCVLAVEDALAIGYRLIDTAEIYGNQKEIGIAWSNTGIQREDLFITSKVWVEHLHAPDVFTACEQTLEDLRTDYLDLYLIHWPQRQVPLSETMEALQTLQKKGKIRSIGVSNFNVHHLEDLLKLKIPIVTNQVEFHPTFNQKALKKFCEKKNIFITAYSPLGRGKDLGSPIIRELSRQHQATPAQIILAWGMAKNMVMIPKASSKERLQENFDALRVALSREDIWEIDRIKTHGRLVNPPVSDFGY